MQYQAMNDNDHRREMEELSSGISDLSSRLDAITGGKGSIPKFFDPADLTMGSYGPHVDKYLGRSPCDGPPGYIFQKVSYSAGSVASKTNVAGMYKMCSDHIGLIYASPTTDKTLVILQSAVSTSGNTITSNGHGFANGTRLTYANPDSGTLLAPLTDGGTFFVVETATNTFKLASSSTGSALSLTNDGNDTQTLTESTETRINEDGADLSGTTDPTPSGISGEAKLVPGDLILGAILQLVDTRSSDNRTGFVTAGLVSNDSVSPDSYGPELAADPSQFITGSSISGGRTHAANGLKACSVASPNLSIYKPITVATAKLDLSPGSIGAPINAINVSGISGTTSNQIRFVLHVYALVGARQKTISHYTQPDASFKMECLARQFTEHPVSMTH